MYPSQKTCGRVFKTLSYLILLLIVNCFKAAPVYQNTTKINAGEAFIAFPDCPFYPQKMLIFTCSCYSGSYHTTDRFLTGGFSTTDRFLTGVLFGKSEFGGVFCGSFRNKKHE